MSDGEEIRKGWERLRTRGYWSLAILDVLLIILVLVSIGLVGSIIKEVLLQVSK